MTTTPPRIAVIIPCYRVKDHILDVIKLIGDEVSRIYVVDDCCPDQSGAFVAANCNDARITVINLEVNQGVGGAVIAGYRAAIANDMDILVKIDGDGQMDPRLIPSFVHPIAVGDADYTKGNRFFNITDVRGMPTIRILGNAVLSFMCKLSSGYWHIFDPTNGFTALHSRVASYLNLEKVCKRYFFESDMLFRLNTIKAAVVDVPMPAKYGTETSNLKIHKIFIPFLLKHTTNSLKRVFYNYYLRDMSVASFELPVGLILLVFGIIYGIHEWAGSIESHLPSSAGTVMLAALPILVGLQFLLGFIGYDIASTPTRSIHKGLPVQSTD